MRLSNSFIKENGQYFSDELTPYESLTVVKYIISQTTISDLEKQSIVKQFLNNWINVNSVWFKFNNRRV